ncbi:adenosylcobinamide-GDP ribazoletransferase [Allocatelliglobosispora scoriae]|uniref:Adenosylcobinamide-GDP ribazoletransferase n=1 Tax=Allocatelliglobosispora scoriae TaxID=643052 RepID=A0A841BK70_9ACTN|nr:adenosylcobinamide-GDP ribazoletransferase [Allocatelliglobosispora scoriae]MBB5869497.1 adenosylcobinamide-GDP ribazoletransferase [Allocatelliglobosispora scoriae]
MAVGDGLRLAITTFTVFPLRAGRVDRAAGAVAISVAPAVGALLGLVVGGVGWSLSWLGTPALVAGALAVGTGVLLTRGLHLDGLADTTDALGSYGGPERALEIMKKPDIGPFGVAAICLDLLIQTACLTALVTHPAATALVATATAMACGRLAVTVACARGVPAARPGGLGALVAGSVPPVVVALAAVAVGLLAVRATPAHPWQGPVVVAVATAVTAVLLRHLVRRFGGITGDVLGFVLEVSTGLCLVGLTLD